MARAQGSSVAFIAVPDNFTGVSTHISPVARKKVAPVDGCGMSLQKWRAGQSCIFR